MFLYFTTKTKSFPLFQQYSGAIIDVPEK